MGRLLTALLAAALGLTAPAAAEDKPPALDEAALRSIYGRLSDAAKLPVDARLEMDLSAGGAGVDCKDGGRLVVRGGAPAVGVACLPEDAPEFGVVAISGSFLDRAKNEDQAAVILAHEMGHILAEDSLHLQARGDKLYKEWLDALPADRRKKLEEDAKKDDPRVWDYWVAQFLAEKGDVLDSYVLESEDKADAYACRLLNDAGFDPIRAAGAFYGTADAVFEESKGARSALSDKTHAPYPERADRMLQCGLGPPKKDQPSSE